ncbi:nucleoside recognition domain-containing protein [Lihuaxuella thermophila]|uniref:Nucleoside recognition n=1 Tax=Lihuaxuella thermophila TaxID=1173111 RepID=A0A1H8AE83_9BACL|nr:nucleoside recognition domain-containing protein [Lihuaxuella thermophila]SEM68148.1 Nucleoside recognition [Lihuaxuella thermophila]
MYSIDWRKGWQAGLKTSWELAKVVFPVTLLVQLVKHTPLMGWITQGLAPFMSWIGLPGEAAIPLVLGNILNLYAGIGAVLTLDLTVKQVFIIALMLSFSHNLLIESALCKRVGVATWVVLLVRMGLAVLSALLIHWLWIGGNERAVFAGITPQESEPAGWFQIAQGALVTAAQGVITLVVIVIPLMMLIQILKDLRFLDWLSKGVAPLLRPFGIAPRGAVTLASGLLVGLFFGAGIIIQQAEEQSFSRRDIHLLIIFLAACHAVIEDTLIFVPLGIPVLHLLWIRFLAAVIVTLLVARFWKTPAVQPVAAVSGK